jgi:predicted GIY-YIG superfamily endonuclease
MNRNCGIYKITSPTGKVYIGQAVDIERRLKDGIRRLF